MKRVSLIVLSLAFTPLAAFAMPAVGDVIPTNPTEAAAALTAAGCTDATYESEGGMIDARCTDSATGLLMEVMIDPQTGVVGEIKQGD